MSPRHDESLLVEAVPWVGRWMSASHGDKDAVVIEACTALGDCSRHKFYQLARRVAGKCERQRRSDAGQRLGGT